MAGKRKKKRAGRSKRPIKKKGRAHGGTFIKTVLLLAVLLSLSAVVLFFLPVKRGEYPPPPAHHKTVLKEIRVFKVTEDGKHLKGLKTKINKGDIHSEVKEALALLIKNRKDIAGSIPRGTRLLGLKIEATTAYVNLSGEVSKNHGGGTMGELLTIYSIVDTVTLNFPEIKDIQILIDGRIQRTLKGHIDISFPLGPNRKIIKG